MKIRVRIKIIIRISIRINIRKYELGYKEWGQMVIMSVGQ